MAITRKTAEGMLLMLDRFFLEAADVEVIRLWDVLTALRPDDENPDGEAHTATYIRAKAFPEANTFIPGNSYYYGVMPYREANNQAAIYNFSFLRHYARALEALKEMGIPLPEAL